MNYFELYNLPITFHPDPQLVKQKFYELSKKFHPDFHINHTAAQQDEALELSTLNNKAFQVLKSPKETLQYVLNLTGTVVEGENYTLPQSFLMEMMDVNEALMDLEFDQDAAKLEQVESEVATIEKSLNDQLNQLISSYDQKTEEQQQVLAQIKDVFYRNKYLIRIKDRLSKLKSM